MRSAMGTMLHHNKVIFNGRLPLVDSIVHNAKAFVSWCFRRMSEGEGTSCIVSFVSHHDKLYKIRSLTDFR